MNVAVCDDRGYFEQAVVIYCKVCGGNLIIGTGTCLLVLACYGKQIDY